MRTILLLYYSSCHALAISCTIFAFIRRGMISGGSVAPDAVKPSRDLRFAVMLSFLSLSTVGMAYGFFQYNEAVLNPALAGLYSGISLLGLAGLIFAVPFFAASFEYAAGSRPPVLLFGILALTVLPCIPFILDLGIADIPRTLRFSLSLFPAAAFITAFSWSMLHLVKTLKALGTRKKTTTEVRRWRFTLKAGLALGLVFCPLSIASDFFLLPLALWGVRLPQILPLLAVGIGLSHLAGSLRANIELRRSVSQERVSVSGGRTVAQKPHEAEWRKAGLTPRETEVARLLVSGYTYRGIAGRLGIGAATVKTHILKVYDKTGAGNKLELLLFAD